MPHRHATALLLGLLLAGCVTPSPSGSAQPTPTPSAADLAAPTTTPHPTSTPSPTPIPTPASAILPGHVNRSSLAVSATYDVSLDVVVASGDIDVTTVIVVRNDSGEPIDRLDLNTVAARLGAIRLGAVSVDGVAATAAIDDQTIAVDLGGLLPAGATTTVRLAYTARLRRTLTGSDWLFSRVNGGLAMYRWIPWVSRAVPFDRPNHGDPFVTPSSPRVHLTVTTDRPMILASPGAAPVADGLTWTFEVTDVRDVAIVLAPDLRVAEGTAGRTRIRVYTRPGGLSASKVLAQAQRAITRIGDRLGVPYPWSDFTVIQTEGAYGMESPGLIWIPKQTAAGNLAYLVHHETAHQWFYGLVGNDQQSEPFADEAAADMVARTVLGLNRASRCPAAALDRAITRYSRLCYYEDIYIQGGLVLNQIRRTMGSDLFWATIRDYLEANRFGLAGTRQLLEALRAASPVSIRPILRARFPALYP